MVNWVICCDNNKCMTTHPVTVKKAPTHWITANIGGKWGNKFRQKANFCSEKCRQEFFEYWGSEWTDEEMTVKVEK